MTDKPTQSALENIHARSIRVGNITQTINYYQPAQALSTTVNNWLPPLPGAWQSRSEEQTISNYLTNTQVRLVGIYGAGGFGKSALAAQVFRQAEGFSHKLWANFQEPTDFGTFGRWLIQELLGKEVYAKVRELYERDENAELIVKTLNELGQRRCLLVLDNLETLFQDDDLWQPYGDFLAGWLGLDCAGSLVLTSQYQLDLPGSAWRWLPLRGLESAQGVALLQAQGIEGSDEQLTEFVDKADGHPLLLRLAASWLQRREQNELEPAAIYQLQHDDPSLLEGIFGQHRGDAEATVGKLLDLSFSRLHPEWLQVLLWRLSVLRGSFGLEMAQAMVSEVLNLAQVRQLARWSFVQEQKVAGEWRFKFLPLIGRYLQLRAKAAGEEINGHQQAIKYFSDHVQMWDGKITSCAEELEIFYHLCEQGEYQLADRLIDGCFNQLELAGYYQELVKVYERLTSEWQHPANDNESYNLGWAWTRLGNLYHRIGRVSQAITTHCTAQQLFDWVDSARGKASSLSNLGNAFQSLGEYQRAIDCHNQSLDISQEIGDPEGIAVSFGNLGNTCKSLGKYKQAIIFFHKSFLIQQKIGNRQGEANSLGNIGSVYNFLGEYQQAIELGLQSLSIKQAIGDRQGEINPLCNLGISYYLLGKYQQAIDFHLQSLAISKEIGDLQGEANSLGNLGSVHNSLEEYQWAIDYFQKSLAISKEIGDRNGNANSLGSIGNAYQSLGKYKQAIVFYQQSLDIQQEIGDRYGEANSLDNLGNVYQSLSEHQQAIDFFQQSLAIKQEIGDRHGEARTLLKLRPYLL
jgi:tetratricopeptide (TPR) repeat protein